MDREEKIRTLVPVVEQVLNPHVQGLIIAKII
jgi:hypothetical protein